MDDDRQRRLIRIVDYDPGWPAGFRRLQDHIWPSVADLALRIEHVGSTAVPGLAAKPIIDLDIVIRDRATLPDIGAKLEALGYFARGDLGIADRYAYAATSSEPPHNLYACVEGSVALRNHLALRDHLRAHPEDAKAYGELKKALTEGFPDDIDQYVAGKTALIARFLAQAGFESAALEDVRAANRPK
jgi:GrpB-like predicted nucleotidyltransferase (UPF0157 family)